MVRRPSSPSASWAVARFSAPRWERRSSNSTSSSTGSLPLLAQVAAEQALAPGALVAAVGHQTDADLVDGQRQSVVDLDRAVARLDAAVEEQPRMDPGYQVEFRPKNAAPARCRSRVVEQREDAGAGEPLPRLLLPNRLMHFALDAAILVAEVSRQPGVDVEDVLQLLAEVLPVVGRGDRHLVWLRRRESGVKARFRVSPGQRLGHRSLPSFFFPPSGTKFDRISQTSPSRFSNGSAEVGGNRMSP